MKNLFVLLLAAATLCGCSQATTVAEDQEVTAGAAADHTYGTAFTEENVLSASQLQEAVAGQDSIQATVTAEVVQSCQSKGCWMDVKLQDGSTMKVTFRDYGFFLPVEDLSGRKVVFTGTAKHEVISVDDQRHFAEDAGKTADEVQAITQPKEELRFVADGVILK
ncbi:DUF4920 domain-containing protein [Pontibacter sp. JH31]|uniref:DUF4920 domain-containing protein n=1 Tax=Pontibacter aquaedesilientis TaxID=2766980 RepID=A0ABR7XC98_9BACT|nr:DUF4920 domain-containing protein [Pontibacter aquaedesilientis]MBD1395924.1 DUF4920 domain-containing protein [Pontibacter aquaedesilientis]